MFVKSSMCSKYVPCFVSMISLVQSATLLSVAEVEKTESSLLNASDASSSSTNEDLSHLTDEFLECLKIKLLLNDYILLDNASLYAPVYANLSSKGLWEYGNYYIDRSNESFPVALLCPPISVPPKQVAKSQSEDFLRFYITLVGLCISLLGLALHFAAFLVVPEMKNLHGKNLASLTVSLFFLDLLFLMGKLKFDKTPICYPLGICIYYFAMVSLFWMNVVFYHIFKSVRAATNKLKLMSKSAEFKWFILYSAYAWLIPAILSGIIVACQKSTFFPEKFRPKFDEGLCWYARILPLVLFFASPVALLILANIIFFIASAVIIFSNSMRSYDHTSRLTRNIALYLKLAFIMGLVWVMSLVASIMEEDVLWYVFVALATSQGLFIFIVFTKFRKTGTHMKERVNPSFLTSSNYSITHSNNACALIEG